MLPVSNDTVLRVVRARARPRTEPLNVVGIDDWPQLWNNRLRPGATTHRDPLAGSRDGNS
jgi:hypothetical protein